MVALLGARQVGKSTLARQIAAAWEGATTYFDLEDPRAVARLESPMLALEGLRGLVVLDEIQRRPELFPALRVLADRPGPPSRFLVLGSASPALLRQSSESLAGRVTFYDLDGFDLDETAETAETLWLRGGFPRSMLAPDDRASRDWRDDFIRTFLERDLPSLGVTTASATIGQFWTMIAHYHAQTWNGAELGRAFGRSNKTVERYLDVLEGAYVVFRLRPWHENLRKRQVKSPKVYLRDSGLLHALLGLETQEDLLGHPKRGASWEGFALRQVLARLGTRSTERFFWATHGGAELDLLVVRGRRRLAFEVKLTDAPSTTKSMHVAMRDLKLERIDVVHAGAETYPLTDRIRAVALSRVFSDIEPL